MSPLEPNVPQRKQMYSPTRRIVRLDGRPRRRLGCPCLARRSTRRTDLSLGRVPIESTRCTAGICFSPVADYRGTTGDTSLKDTQERDDDDDDDDDDDHDDDDGDDVT